jgi:hypothetical protein
VRELRRCRRGEGGGVAVHFDRAQLPSRGEVDIGLAKCGIRPELAGEKCPLSVAESVEASQHNGLRRGSGLVERALDEYFDRPEALQAAGLWE